MSPPGLPRRGTASSSSAPRGHVSPTSTATCSSTSAAASAASTPATRAPRVHRARSRAAGASFSTRASWWRLTSRTSPWPASCAQSSRSPGPTKAALFNSGAEAVENAVKIARSRHRPARGARVRSGISRPHTARPVADQQGRRPTEDGFGPFAPEVYRLPIPDLLRRPHGTSVDEWVGHGISGASPFSEEHGRSAVDRVRHHRARAGRGRIHRAAARVSARAAHVPARNTASSSLPTRCRPGFGRTGRMFACERVGLEPDLVCLAKSLSNGFPLSARGGARRDHGRRAAGRPGRHIRRQPGRVRRGARRPSRRIEQDGLVDRAEAIGARRGQRASREWRRGIPSSPRRAGWAPCARSNWLTIATSLKPDRPAPTGSWRSPRRAACCCFQPACTAT